MPLALIEGALDGRFDAGIGFDPGPVRGLATAVFQREPLCLAVPTGHRLAGAGVVTPDALIDEPLIASPSDVTPTLRRAILDYFARAGGVPIIRLETQLQQTIVSLVAERIGVALVPRSPAAVWIGQCTLLRIGGSAADRAIADLAPREPQSRAAASAGLGGG